MQLRCERRMTRLIATTTFIFVLSNCVAAAEGTAKRHGVSIEYDTAEFPEAVWMEEAAKPRPRNHVPRHDDYFRPPSLTIRLRTAAKIGHASVKLTSTAHRTVQYFDEAYPDTAGEIRKLKELLRDRPAHPEIDAKGETVHPVSQGPAHLVSKVRYVDFPWGSAIAFLEFSAQDFGPAAGFDAAFGWTRLNYYMYGLTADERYYVCGTLDVVLPELERGENKRIAEEHVTNDEYFAYLKRATRLMEQRPHESFSPSLSVLHKLMATLTINPKEARLQTWHRFRDRKVTVGAE